MSDYDSFVSVSVRLTPKQAGALYMKSMRQADRIRELQDYLRRIATMAEAGGNQEIAVAAKAALEPVKEANHAAQAR